MPSMSRNCRVTGEPFEVSEWEQAFCERMGVPLPTLCPDERQRKRLAHRNERHLYKRGCDLCKKTMIAIYPAEAPFPVYCGACWWSDGWNAMNHGQDFDFGRPFFEQFKELYFKTPRVGVLSRNGENSEYTNCEEGAKNCYLTFGGGYSEDCMYSHFCVQSRDCVDCSLVHSCELCYEGVELENCYHCLYLRDSQNCSDCFLGVDLVGCKNCFGCAGLRNKEYYIFNQAHSKEEYEKKVAELYPKLLASEVQETFTKIRYQTPCKYAHVTNSSDCSGDYILNSDHCKNCYDIKQGKDGEHIYWGQGFKDSYDSNVIYIGVELIYNSQSICINCFNVRCSNFSWNISLSDYCDSCHYSKNLFGCVGVQHKENCILNKQYSKEEYEVLVLRIIEHMKQTGEWGEFFPFSVFAYNETVGQEYLPLTKAEAVQRGYEWREDSVSNLQAAPDVQKCTVCSKPFKLIQKELDYYTKLQLPLPAKCHDCRHKARMAQRNPRQLWDRVCGKCGASIQSTYSPDRPELVYCESCYLAAVY